MNAPLAAALLRRVCYDRCPYWADHTLTEDELQDWCDTCPVPALRQMLEEEST